VVATLNAAEWAIEIVIIVLLAALLVTLLVVIRRSRGADFRQPASDASQAWEPGGGIPAPATVTGTPAPAVAAPPNPTPGTPASWLPDPSGVPHTLRYWDGSCWTPHVARRT
jgi:hypothetical protein